jgi:peptide/nickel transport system permease protein
MRAQDQSTQTAFQENLSIFTDILKKNPMYLVSLCIVVVYLGYSAIAFINPSITGYNPSLANLSASLHPPSVEFPFGTDEVGKDLYREVLFGAPIDAIASISIIFIAITIGALTGSIAGYFGGVIDDVVMRVTDIFLAFPALVLAVAVAAALGPGLFNAVMALAVAWWPMYTRITRGETISLKENQYVLAAKASGTRKTKIVLSHIVPNLVSPLLAYATADIGNAIILFSLLGYLGLGAQPPFADLGRIVYDGQVYLQLAPWYPLLPGAVVFVIVISFALVGDFARDFIDPKMHR